MSEEFFRGRAGSDPVPEIENSSREECQTGAVPVRIIRRKKGEDASERLLLREQALRISLDGKLLARLVCTGKDLPELAAGWLLTEGAIARASDLTSLRVTGSGREFLAEGKSRGKVPEKPVLVPAKYVAGGPGSGPECSGASNAAPDFPGQPLKPVISRKIRREWIFHLADTFRTEQPLYAATHSIHSCILSRSGTVLYVCEDIGRHNALDKACGYALLNGIPPAECEIYLSGRLPVDMVEKAVRAGFPVLAGKALPTAEAVKLAASCGLMLAGRVGTDSFVLFCGEKNLV